MRIYNPYRLLGGSAHDSDDELRALYRTAAREAHPDRGGDAVRFVAVREAYDSVATPAQRRRLALRNAMAGQPCAACAATGAQRKQRGLTAATYTLCNGCDGCGYV